MARRSSRDPIDGMGARHPFATLSFAKAFGTEAMPIDVPAWKSVVLVRAIPGTDYHDAMGCYPCLPLAHEARLSEGLAQLREMGFVSVVLVTDPLHGPPAAALRQTFDLCRFFKTHYVCDHRLGSIDRSHRRWRRVQIAREALRIAEVRYPDHVETCAELYGNLIDRHRIIGVTAFEGAFFARLAEVEGIRAVGGFLGDDMVSVMLYVQYGTTLTSFLAGTSAEGRRLCAHYGLYAEAIERFADIEIVNLGGAPGLVDDPDHPIAHVKRKLTNCTLQSFLCGSILNHDVYHALGGGETAYFPAYRRPVRDLEGARP